MHNGNGGFRSLFFAESVGNLNPDVHSGIGPAHGEDPAGFVERFEAPAHGVIAAIVLDRIAYGQPHGVVTGPARPCKVRFAYQEGQELERLAWHGFVESA